MRRYVIKKMHTTTKIALPTIYYYWYNGVGKIFAEVCLQRRLDRCINRHGTYDRHDDNVFERKNGGSHRIKLDEFLQRTWWKFSKLITLAFKLRKGQNRGVTTSFLLIVILEYSPAPIIPRRENFMKIDRRQFILIRNIISQKFVPSFSHLF